MKGLTIDEALEGLQEPAPEDEKFLCVVVLENPYYPKFAKLEVWADGTVQEIATHQEGGRMIPGVYKGDVRRFEEIRPYVMRIQKTGVDLFARGLM